MSLMQTPTQTKVQADTCFEIDAAMRGFDDMMAFMVDKSEGRFQKQIKSLELNSTNVKFA